MAKPIVFETFQKLDRFEQERMESKEPSCWNGIVSFRKYRITVEPVDEPREVLEKRILDLWEKCDNHHNYGPLRAAAEELGIKLDSSRLGKAVLRK